MTQPWRRGYSFANVTSCGGTKAAEEFADKIIITDDNPRTETAEQIIVDIKSGFSSQEKVEVIHDRKQAIQQVIAQAGEKDLVLIAGKGHEDYQIVGDMKLPFSDTKIVQDSLGIAE